MILIRDTDNSYAREKKNKFSKYILTIKAFGPVFVFRFNWLNDQFFIVYVSRRQQTEEPAVSIELGLDLFREGALCGGWRG